MNNEDEWYKQTSKHTKPSNRLSKWLNSILIIIVFTILPWLYFSGYISMNWINRIGIILNFLAGFMVAPELIGQERLSKAESFSEHHLKKIHVLLTKTKALIEDRLPNIEINLPDFPKMRPYTIAGALITLLFFLITFYPVFYIDANDRRSLQLFFSGCLSLLIILPPVARIFVVILETPGLSKKMHVILSESKDIVVTFPIMILSMLGALMVSSLAGSLLALGISILMLFIDVSSLILGKLAGDDRLRYMLIGWGIIFFVLGNLLQFIATF